MLSAVHGIFHVILFIAIAEGLVNKTQRYFVDLTICVFNNKLPWNWEKHILLIFSAHQEQNASMSICEHAKINCATSSRKQIWFFFLLSLLCVQCWCFCLSVIIYHVKQVCSSAEPHLSVTKGSVVFLHCCQFLKANSIENLPQNLIYRCCPHTNILGKQLLPPT